MPAPLPPGPLPDTSIGTPGVPPLPPGGGIDLASLMGMTGGGGGVSGGQDYQSAIAAQQSQLTNAQSQMASDFSQVNDLANRIVTATTAQGTDEAAIATQQAQGLLKAQEAARSVAASYGGNPDDVSFIMNKLGQQWMQSEAERQQALDVVQKKQSVSFMDDPLTWLSNKLTINRDIAMYNDDEERSNTLYDQLNKINELNSSTAKSMQAIAQTQTAATVAATSDAALQKATIAANDAKLKGVLYNVQGIKDITQLGQQEVDNSVKAAQTAIAAGHLAVAQQQVTIMRDEYEQKAALYAQEVKDKQRADATDEYVADKTNIGRAALGLNPLPPAKIFAMFKLGGDAGEALKQQFSIGSISDATGKTIIAPSTGTAARVLATNNSPLGVQNPAVKPVLSLLSDSYNTARNPQNQQQFGINPKDVNTLDNAVSGIVGQRVVQMASNIKPGDNSNIFQAPPLTALATLPAVKQNPLYQKVLEPQVKAGLAETDPTNLVSLTVDAIKQGQINLSDGASGLASLFNAAAALNTSTKDYMRFGIAPQTGYHTTVEMTGLFGGSTKVDMTNKAQVATVIMRYLANQSKLESLQMGGGQ